MADHQKKDDTNEGATFELNQLSSEQQAQILKNIGIYQPNYCETIDQANRRYSGLMDSLKRQGRELSELRGQKVYNTAQRPKDSNEEQQRGDDEPNNSRFTGVANTTITNTFELLKLRYPDIEEHYDRINTMISENGSFYHLAKANLHDAIVKAYFNIRGEADYRRELAEIEKKSLEVERNRSSRLEQGAPTRRMESSPTDKIQKQITKAFDDFNRVGPVKFKAMYDGKTLSQYVDEMNEQMAIVKESEGG